MSTPSSSSAAEPSLFERSLESLDWPFLVEALAERASTIVGRERCETLPFHEHPLQAREALADVAEMLALYEEQTVPPLGGISDLREALIGATKGEILDGSVLLRVSDTLDGLSRLHGHLARDPEANPRLWAVARDIRPMPDLAHRLRASFDSRGELSASTYPQLSSLRSKKARLHQRIQSTLTSLRQEDRYTDALQDDFLAMRNDRYVVPVRSGHKRSGLGIVHDTSGSGQTVFVEPYEVIEANNDLKMADAELAREERRILRSLTENVGFAAAVIHMALDAATHVDIVHAKAVLARDLNASVPAVDDEPGFILKAARHPVLVLRGIEVVPNDLNLGGDTRALILSGPNTGGKTVTLKTLGLTALMVRAGLPVPAAEGSRVGWLDLVLTDIGDAQDVEGDLSTFSGHVLNLVEILSTLDAAPSSALVLLDEIAAGTDPVQGAGFGRAMLEGMLERGVLLATTTHYPELKALSGADARFVNARVEFDGDRGVPTYRLTVGQAGSSHALDVAAALGVEGDILERARSYLGHAAMQVEDMLASVEAQLLRAERARVEAEEAAQEAEQQRARADLIRRDLEKERRGIERTVRSEFQREVQGYREQVKAAMRQMRAERTEAQGERARARVREGAAAVLGTLGTAGPDEGISIDWSAARIGDPVRVLMLGKDGVVDALPDGKGKLFVTVGGRRMQVKTTDLGRGEPPAPKPKKPKAKFPNSKKKGKKSRRGSSSGSDDGRAELELESAVRNSRNVVDLRGQSVDEALGSMDRFMDEASLSGEPFVFVLHGLGTGAIRNAVRLHLRRSGYVSEFAPGTRAQGGDGITVAAIK